MKKVLMLASVASMIDQFNMQNIAILKGLGYEVDVAANFEQGSTSSSDRMDKFKKELKDQNIDYYHIDFSRSVTNISKNIKAYNQIKKLMKENKYEFVHCHSPIGGVCGRLAAKSTKTKSIYTAHGFHFYKGASIVNWTIYYPIEKILSYITDTLITINQEDYELAKRKMKAKNIYYVPGVGVDTQKYQQLEVDVYKKREELGIPKDSTVLLSVGELNKNKNHEVIIRALAKIDNSNLYYVVAGRGQLEEYLTNLAKELGVSDRVSLLGFRTDIFELYKSSDIFCFPSYREGLSVSLMEAMACGLPVICSNIRGNTDLIENNSGGFLCEPEDVNKFVEYVENIVNNDVLASKIASNNLKKIEKFGIKSVEQNMNSIYIDINETDVIKKGRINYETN